MDLLVFKAGIHARIYAWRQISRHSIEHIEVAIGIVEQVANRKVDLSPAGRQGVVGIKGQLRLP